MRNIRANAGILAALLCALSACSGAATVTITPDFNPTVPPPTPVSPAALTLDDLPTLPDALTITPGDAFTVQTTHAPAAQIEAYYAAALGSLGLALVDRQEDAAGLFGRGLRLTFASGEVRVYAMVIPDFEDGATGVLLTLDGSLLGLEE